MAIKFIPRPQDNLFISEWQGHIADEEIISSYQEFLSSSDFSAGMNEITDMSQSDCSAIKVDTFQRLAVLAERMLATENVTMKTAIVAPGQLSFGLSRMYMGLAHGSGESIGLFETVDDAMVWLSEADGSNS